MYPFFFPVSAYLFLAPVATSESSPDDVFLLTSAVDNEVKQYLAVDGRLHMDLDVPKTGLEENFTRSYYTSSGRWVVSGLVLMLVLLLSLLICFFVDVGCGHVTAPPVLFQDGSRGRASPEDGSGREAPPSVAAGVGVQVRGGRGGRAAKGARVAPVASDAG